MVNDMSIFWEHECKPQQRLSDEKHCRPLSHFKTENVFFASCSFYLLYILCQFKNLSRKCKKKYV